MATAVSANALAPMSDLRSVRDWKNQRITMHYQSFELGCMTLRLLSAKIKT